MLLCGGAVLKYGLKVLTFSVIGLHCCVTVLTVVS